MALPARQQFTYWSIAAAVLLLILWKLGAVLLPFILGCAVAYVLDPIADRLERAGLSRVMATAVISVSFLLLVIVVMLLVVPTLFTQTLGLIDTLPELTKKTRFFFYKQFPSLGDPNSPLTQSMVGIGETIRAKGGEVLQTVLNSALGIFNVVMLIFIVPVVSFYMLIDWDHMVSRIDKLLPRDHAPVIRKLAHEMDETMASFIRGQGLVCLIQGTFYAVTLMIAGLNFGLVIGVVAGMVTFIPYVGSIVGGAMAIGLAAFQFWDHPLMIAVVAGIFFTGQMIEGNILTPKLVGSSVGLHPVWLLLALSIFGSLFGFVGMLVAVPVAAMIGVLVRFLMEIYTSGLLYQGLQAKFVLPDRGNEPDA